MGKDFECDSCKYLSVLYLPNDARTFSKGDCALATVKIFLWVSPVCGDVSQ